ncbi:MAG: hypothetical protein U9R19_07670 [Bacteroidota bacterium]|nr:hypothetical protein [Bacteroidota bacterium]
MKDKLSKILSILQILLVVISGVIVVVFYVGTSQFSVDAEFAEQMNVLGGKLDIFLNWAIFLVLAAALAAILFPIFKMISDPKNSKKTLIMVGAMVVVALLAYMVSSDIIHQFHGYKKFFYDEITMDANLFSKYVDTGIWAMYILGVLSLLSILYYEVAKAFK